MVPEIVKGLEEAPKIGKYKMFSEFVRDRLEKACKPLCDVIPGANVYTFSNQPPAYLKRRYKQVRISKGKYIIHHKALPVPTSTIWG
jgi:hypothetical protein